MRDRFSMIAYCAESRAGTSQRIVDPSLPQPTHPTLPLIPDVNLYANTVDLAQFRISKTILVFFYLYNIIPLWLFRR